MSFGNEGKKNVIVDANSWNQAVKVPVDKVQTKSGLNMQSTDIQTGLNWEICKEQSETAGSKTLEPGRQIKETGSGQITGTDKQGKGKDIDNLAETNNKLPCLYVSTDYRRCMIKLFLSPVQDWSAGNYFSPV